MSKARLAASMPGKLGDVLYVLPTLRAIYGITGKKFDFYTSDYCEPLRNLFLYQPYIENFIIPDNYKIERMDMGCQPWDMPIPNNYEQIFQLGFRSVPDKSIHQFIASSTGLDIPLDISYDYPEIRDDWPYRDYVCIAPRGNTSYGAWFDGIANSTKSIIVGSASDYRGIGLNFTGYDMLDTLIIMSACKAFVGIMSSQLVLANGFDIPKIIPHDGKSWDMRHVVYSEYHHYLVNPTVIDALTILEA